MAKEFECERDGVVIRGADDDELVANVQRHIAEAHPDLAGKVSRQDILGAAKEAGAMRGAGEMTAGDGLVLRLQRILPAPRADVYRALSDPGELAKWWGPRGFTAPRVEFDPQVGGSYRIAMQPPDRNLFHLSGEFREVDPPARLAYTFRWDPPDPDDRQTVVTLSLEDRGERTEVLLTHGEFATEERRALHEEGWADSLGRLEQILRGHPPIRHEGTSPMDRMITRARLLLGAAALLALLVVPAALAADDGGPSGAQASASGVQNKIKKLKKQVKALQQQVDELARQPGPQGPQGPEGQQGPPGPSTGPAGGDLTGSYPDPLIGPNAVGSTEIADEAVGIDDIGRNAVGVSQIVDDNITSDKIANDAVNNSEIANAAVSSAEIANGNVLSVDLGGGAVEAANLGSAFAVVGTGVLVQPGTSREATVSCPGGSRLLSGGFEWLSEDADGSSVISSSPTFVGDPNKTWVVRGRSDTGGPGNTIFAEALCLNA